MSPEEVAAAVERQRAAEMRPTLKVSAGEFTYPDDHQPGMEVPEGGSSCANCRFVVPNGPMGVSCSEPNFIAAELPGKPRGETKLPVQDSRRYCSDYWQPATVISLEHLKATGSI